LYDFYLDWKTYSSVSNFWDDMSFIGVIYVLVMGSMLLHDKIDPNEKHFVGQVYDFKDGEEYTVY
jgi:hypothetical protein